MIETTPYRIPAPPERELQYDGTADRKAAMKMLAMAAAGTALSFMVGAMFQAPGVAVLGVVVSFVLALVGAVRALAGVVRVGASEGHGKGMPLLKLAGSLLANLAFLAVGVGAAWLAAMTFTRGRQLRRRGKVLLPEVVRGTEWAHLPAQPVGGHPQAPGREVPAEVREPLAAQWRENGRTEHASVAAFARLTMDLIALGAPPRLVADAQKDALDEIHHAELCFSLARALDGVARGPAPFPEARDARALPHTRALALAELAVDSLVDGALNEGVSARVIAKLARRCEVASVRAVLKELAADEGRHASHGWDVVEWCLSEGGRPVAAALEGAARTLPMKRSSPLSDDARSGGWERYGVHGHALEAEEYGKARADIVMRVHRMVQRTRSTALTAS